MMRKKKSDEDLKKILEEVFLGPVLEREGSLDAINEW